MLIIIIIIVIIIDVIVIKWVMLVAASQEALSAQGMFILGGISPNPP
jgi:hypothetical protein